MWMDWGRVLMAQKVQPDIVRMQINIQTVTILMHRQLTQTNSLKLLKGICCL